MKSAILIKIETYEPLKTINQSSTKVRTVGFIISDYLNPMKFVKELMKYYKINDFEEFRVKIKIPQENYVYIETNCKDSTNIIDAEKIDMTSINEIVKALEFVLILALPNDGIYFPDNDLMINSKTINRCIKYMTFIIFMKLFN